MTAVAREGHETQLYTMVDIDPTVDARWDALQSGGGSLFTSSSWLRVVAETYGLSMQARVAIDSHDAPLAGLAYSLFDDPLGLRRVSVPFSDFHGPVGDLLAGAAVVDSLCDGTPIRFRIPTDRLPSVDESEFHSVDRLLLHHRINVPAVASVDELFSSLQSSVRQNIRKSRRAGVELEMRSDLEAVREFYDLHVGVRTRKYRLLPQPFEFFARLHRSFGSGDMLRVALARYEGRAIAGILYLESGSCLYYKFNASSLDDLGVRPNEQLLLAGLEHALDRGLNQIDLGVSDTDQPGLVRYKRRFAHEEQEVVTLHSAPVVGGSMQLRRAFGQLTELFVDDAVPQRIAEEAGAVLYKYFA